MEKSRAGIRFLSILALAASFSSAAMAGPLRPNVIYGDDDRQDIYQVEDARLVKLAASTAALFKESDVKSDPSSGLATLIGEKFGDAFQLCSSEPFFEQPTGAFCSGSLVGPDLILTAGHCVETEEACAQTRFVFGYGISQLGEMPEMVPNEDVYSCSGIVTRDENDNGADYALIRVDRKVRGRRPLAIHRGGDAGAGDRLVVIGHPSGLPTKVSGGAAVRDASPEGYFVANLDTYGGNSGSAVFNAGTGAIEGVLVRGETDFGWDDDGNCRISNRCADDGCRGEDVTKISAVAAFIPETRTVRFGRSRHPVF
ncbi:MAG: trypsin-like peptidase domain-containing protein [Deltaproteobacteria bacterium]|nr:trypsin-like peptidase domain-containing protein [Deltaproteobacteria bacterium]